MKKQKILLFIILIFILTFLFHCDFGSLGFSYGILEVTNSTSQNIYYLYLSPSDKDAFGSNQLDGFLRAGESIEITDIQSGTYDLKAEDSNKKIYLKSNITITADQTSRVTIY